MQHPFKQQGLYQHAQRIEEEQIFDDFNPLKPITNEVISDRLKQNIVSLQFQVNTFYLKLKDLYLYDKIKQLKEKVQKIEDLILIQQNQNLDLDLDQFQQNFGSMKSLYLDQANYTSTLNSIQALCNSFQKNNDLSFFLKNLNQFETYYQDCQPLMFLDQEIELLDMYLTIFDPKVSNYKEILYYENAPTPVQKYKKKDQPKNEIQESELIKLMELLNKFYKFVALPNAQESFVSFQEHDNKTNEQNYEKYFGYKELILFVKITFDDKSKSYAVILIYTNKNQKTCRFISQGKCRPYLKQISEYLGCVTEPPFYNPSFNFIEAINEFLKYVSKNLSKEEIQIFLKENEDYLQKDKYNNEIIDAFDMQKQGFTTQFQFLKA